MDEAEENSACIGDVRWELSKFLWISAQPLAPLPAASEDDPVEANNPSRDVEIPGGTQVLIGRPNTSEWDGSGDTDTIRPLPRERLIGRDAAGEAEARLGTSHKEGLGRVTKSSHLGDLVGRQAHAAECVAGSRGAPRGEGSCGLGRKPC